VSRIENSFAARLPTTHARSSHPSRLSLLHIAPEETLDEVLTRLEREDQPVILILPEEGAVLSHPDHFLALWRLVAEYGRPPAVSLVIPETRPLVAQLATHYSLPHAASLEAALHALLHRAPSAPAPFRGRGNLLPETVSFAPRPEPPRPFPAEPLSEDTPSVGLTRPHAAPFSRRASVQLAALFGVLLLISAFFARLLLVAPPPPASPSPPLIGTLTFTSSGQVDAALTRGYNDIITLTFSHPLPASPAGMASIAWLMPDPTDDSTLPLLLGMLPARATTLTYTSPTHTNLLARYSGVRVTEQSASPPPMLPSQDPARFRAEGWIPDIPTPGDEDHFSFLSHVRHLLAADPTLQANGLAGGLVFWMTRNVAKVEEWASAAQGQWHGTATSPADVTLIQRQMTRMLDYLDGQSYVWRDVPAGSPWLVDQAGGKIGLVNRVAEQMPPGYLEHVALHLQGLAGSPGHTSAQQHLAVLVYRVIERMEADLVRVRADASTVVRMTLSQMRQPATLAILDEMAQLTTQVASGWFDPASGEDIGGSLWILARLQSLASISLHRASARADEQ
jgi:hypothetical protein